MERFLLAWPVTESKSASKNRAKIGRNDIENHSQIASNYRAKSELRIVRILQAKIKPKSTDNSNANHSQSASKNQTTIPANRYWNTRISARNLLKWRNATLRQIAIQANFEPNPLPTTHARSIAEIRFSSAIRRSRKNVWPSNSLH